MALVLTIREGHDFYVSDERFVVTKVDGKHRAVVQRESTKEIWEVTDERSETIMDRVKVSVGKPAPPGMIRMAIEAPRYIPVLRGDKKRSGECRGDNAQEEAAE